MDWESDPEFKRALQAAKESPGTYIVRGGMRVVAGRKPLSDETLARIASGELFAGDCLNGEPNTTEGT